jgi:hypothetical protein
MTERNVIQCDGCGVWLLPDFAVGWTVFGADAESPLQHFCPNVGCRVKHALLAKIVMCVCGHLRTEHCANLPHDCGACNCHFYRGVNAAESKKEPSK